MFQNYEMLIEIRCGGKLFLHGTSTIIIDESERLYNYVSADLEDYLPVPKLSNFYHVNGFDSERYKNYACRAVLRCIPTGKMVTLVNYSLSCPDMPILGGVGSELTFNPHGICTVQVFFHSSGDSSGDRKSVRADVQVSFQNFRDGRDSEFVTPKELLEAIRGWNLDTD